MKKPILSIIIPCYNHGAYLLDAIESIDIANNSEIEVIVVNDGSSDALTLDVLSSISNSEVKVIHQANKGVATARNNGIQQAQGTYILLLDADNKILPAYYLNAIQRFDKDPEIAIYYSNFVRFGIEEETKVELPEFSANRLLTSNFIDACALFRKEMWTKIGGFDPNMPVMGYEDWDFWIRACINGYQFYHDTDALYYYRVAESSMLTNANQAENRHQLVDYVLKKYHSTYVEKFPEVIHFYIEFLINSEAQNGNLIKEQSVHKETIQLSNQHITALEKTIVNQQQRINKIEASKPYKLMKHLAHFKNRFRSNYSDNKKKSFLKKALFIFSKRGRALIKKFLSKIFKYLYLWTEEKQVYIVEATGGQVVGMFGDPYYRWLEKNLPTESKLIAYKKEIVQFIKQPKFSIVIPVYNPKPAHFKAAIESIQQQVYENWEICLADDCSTNPEIKKLITNYCSTDSRIKAVFREKNGHISAASNSALEIATGDYIVLMDQDDLITSDALFQNAKVINAHQTVDLIYSDEDKIDDNNVHTYPHFKPDWSPDSFLSRNYLGHLTVFKSEIMKAIGGWREGFEGSQDYDLVLRFTEQTQHIYHIPLVLYHWRIHEESAASGEDAKPYAYMAAKKALTEALVRRNEIGSVDFLDGFRGYSIRYQLTCDEPLVSIIIPTKDKTTILKKCIQSIFEKSTYRKFEIILVDNNSSEKEFFDFLAFCQENYGDQFVHLRAEIPFNFSKLMNLGVAASKGEYLILLNNDTEVITPDWIEGMLEQAQRPSIGVVGVKLLYPNETIQHAGVVMGLGGAAGHVLVGEDRYGPGYFNYVNMINNYSAVTAACIMIAKNVYHEVHGFDELFTVEYNDVDFCLKVRETGRNNIYLPHVELFHYESISRGHPHMTDESYAKHIHEIGLLKDKWSNYIEYDPCYNPNLTLGAHDFSIRL